LQDAVSLADLKPIKKKHKHNNNKFTKHLFSMFCTLEALEPINVIQQMHQLLIEQINLFKTLCLCIHWHSSAKVRVTIHIKLRQLDSSS
jgi:hypothetical protein